MARLNENIDPVERDIQTDYPLQKSDPEIIPKPTIWPISLAFGITFIFWGFIAFIGLTFVGILITIVAIAGWITDLKE